MRKRLSGFVTALMILFVCVFSSACGDKYKKMEFQVLYAFSENAEEWHDGTNGISLNYDLNSSEEDGGSSLSFNEDGEATLYVKVVVKNVKSKHIDSISLSAMSNSGFSLSTDRVKNKEVFEMKVSGNVDTYLKLYENNSGKKHETSVVISKTLESIVANKTIKPAVATNGSVDLLRLNNLAYHPIGETNQIGVEYSVESIGYYQNGVYLFSQNKEAAQNFIEIKNGVLKVKDGSFFKADKKDDYIIRVRATSLFHKGDLEKGIDPIYDEFDVYVVETSVETPVVKFDDVNGKVVGEGKVSPEIHIYENGGNYSSSTVYVDVDASKQSSKYFEGLASVDKLLKYKVVVYVFNENDVYEKYEFNSKKHQSGINGLIVKDNENGTYTLSIANRKVEKNRIKFAYEIDGLDFSCSQPVLAEKAVTVIKGVVPTYITVNNSLDLNSSSQMQTATIYGTKSETYKGLQLKFDANPINNPFQKMKLVCTDENGRNIEGGLEIRLANGNLVEDGIITTGTTVYIKFKDNVMDAQYLAIKTLKAPTYYNETDISHIVENGGDDYYIVARYKFEKLVTADSFAFVQNKNDLTTATNVLIDAENGGSLFVKAYFTGVFLNPSTITLTSKHGQFNFGNGSNKITLNSDMFIKDGADDNGRFWLYEVPVKATNDIKADTIEVVAGDGEINVQASIGVSSVCLMSDDALEEMDVATSTKGINKIESVAGAYGDVFFTISQGEFGEFKVVDGNNQTKSIASISIATETLEGKPEVLNAVRYDVISNAEFTVEGRVSGKTQILKITVGYYVFTDLGGSNSIIEFKEKEIVAQIAVYEAIGNIRTSVTQSTIGYINKYYTEISSTEIAFNSLTRTYGTPKSDVQFAGTDADVVIDGSTQLQVKIKDSLSLAGKVEINFVPTSGNKISLFTLDDDVLIQQDPEHPDVKNYLLEGTIEIKLLRELENIDQIQLTFRALRFGEESNVVTNVVVKVADVDKASNILISGDNLTQGESGENELSFSFMKSTSSSTKSFNASIQFDDVNVNNLRFDRLETALTHVLYQYELDADGKYIYVTDENGKSVKAKRRISDSFFNVTYNDGMVYVETYESVGGGIFKLVLATKDSYIGDETKTRVEETDFAKTCEITVRIEDGVLAAYSIYTVDDFLSINNNLDKKFVLAENIDLSDVDFEPIGKVSTYVNEFVGSLESKYSYPQTITYKVKSSVESDIGILAGLFTVIGERGEINNINLNVEFANSFSSTKASLIVGSLAAINKGTISNVKVFLNSTESTELTASVPINFGGLVGENEGKIQSTTVKCEDELNVVSGSTNANETTPLVHNVGLIAGANKQNAIITGNYSGKDDLNSFELDIQANLIVHNQAVRDYANYFVGAVAGHNMGTVSNFLVGGQINLTSAEEINSVQRGYLGGLVGMSSGVGNNVKTSTAFALNLNIVKDNTIKFATGVNVGGIVGLADSTTIDNAKFITIALNKNGVSTTGQIYGVATVGGIVADATNSSILNSSIESFIDVYEDETNHLKFAFPTIVGGTTVNVVGISENTVENSFARANVLSDGSINLNGSYCIGELLKSDLTKTSPATNSTLFSVVNGELYQGTIKKEIDWKSVMSVDSSINAETTEWKGVYTLDAGKYYHANAFETDKTYYRLNTTAWNSLINGMISSSTSSWRNNESINVIELNGVDVYLPYLIVSGKALMIIKPESIESSLDVEYVVDKNSIYVDKFDFTYYENKVVESVVVNFFAGAGDVANSHTLIGTKDGEGNHLTKDALLDFDLLPDQLPDVAQGGYAYQIIGDGYKFAYINDSNKIVFTGVSGNTPILVRIYSVFDTTKQVFVVFYTQNLLTNLNLSSSSISPSDVVDEYDYEINTYTGQSNKIIAMTAENIFNGENHLTIFNSQDAYQYLRVEIESIKVKEADVLTEIAGENSKLNIDTQTYENITVKIKDGEKVSGGYCEYVTFALYLDGEYYAPYVMEDLKIKTVTLLVRMVNAASNINVIGEDAEKTSKDDINFEVQLTTDWVDESKYVDDEAIPESWTIDDNGNILVEHEDSDGIKIELEILEGDDERKRLIAEINSTISDESKHISHLAQLFDISITSKLLKTNITIGYVYNVYLELIDEHNYRNLISNIKFKIYVSSVSDPTVNNKQDGGIEILLKPTSVTTARIENYVVKHRITDTDYTDLVTSGDVQTSIVQPGSLGNIMMIYLEPTYANVLSASISSSSLYVPSLGREVTMNFKQLVHRTVNGKNVYTTLYGGENYEQVGNTLELEKVSEIGTDGRRTFNGIIYVYIQLERFSGLEGTLTVELNVETENNKEITRTRSLLTTYLPDVNVYYDSQKAIKDGYLIEKGSSKNEVSIEISGYQFNSNPTIEFTWNLTPKTDDDGNIIEGEYLGDYAYLIENGIENKHAIVRNETGDVLWIGNYVSYYLNNGIDNVIYNSALDTYTISLMLNVADNIPASFTFGAELSLTTKNGQLEKSDSDQNKLIFYPTDYILQEMSLVGGGTANIAINKTQKIDFNFESDNPLKDVTSTIYQKLIEYISTGDNPTEKMGELFTYYNNQNLDFSSVHPQFIYNFVNNEVSITGLEKFNTLVNFFVHYGYTVNNNGVAEFSFGELPDDKKQDITKPISARFTLNIYAVNEQDEILVHSADDIFNSATGEWKLAEGGHYVLLNDIELDNVQPITTPIGSFDGNNRVITIKSFKVDNSRSNFGLFDSIGLYTVQDEDNTVEIKKQTLLKNMIVDYSKFNGTIALNEVTATDVTFGGLVAKNNGGLIYNCDVMNLNHLIDAEVSVIVNSKANVIFGGLVGENAGNITNSRVGRNSYQRITATRTTESVVERVAGGLTFKIFNQENGGEKDNNFQVISGGFVGKNTGIISSSYVANTNLVNYSTHETNNITAGFVGINSKDIAYSYVKASNDVSNAYSTGYVIENKGNGSVAGFVYNNTGNINNSYSNIELQTKSAYIAGFVYNNSTNAIISESYAATTMNSSLNGTTALQPFVGVDSAGNLLSTGTIENSYYLMRSEIDTPYTQNDLDIAQGLNLENFRISEHLIGFSFVLSNTRAEREQGVWSYYNANNEICLLPELVNANTIAYSHRYVLDSSAQEKVLTNASSYAYGSKNNPYTISNVEEYNNVFTTHGEESWFAGYVRLINNINFKDDKTSIQTRTNFKLGSTSTKSSIEGNGMTISGIYLDVGESTVDKVGLFAEIENAYVKNLNLEFATPTTEGQFSTTTATYSGGLAGVIKNSVIMNVKLTGTNTTLTGSNFVGGVAGLISGTSLVYGIETNLNVKASGTESYLYYSQTDYDKLNMQAQTYLTYDEYLKKLSYAGGVAGVLDLTKKSNVEHNIQFVDIRGDLMNAKTFDEQHEANILASYAGGVAGYASSDTNSFKLRYITGKDESIRGDFAVGGLYGVDMGKITASQVAAKEDIQYNYDTKIGEYILDLKSNGTKGLDLTQIGNTQLLESYNYAGGLVGVGLNAHINSSYSKASFKSGVDVGGLVGLSIASSINYSYAIPYISLNENLKNVGGLVGSAYAVLEDYSNDEKLKDYEELLEKRKGVKNSYTDIQFTYSTLILENTTLANYNTVNFDYVVANYQATDARGDSITFLRSSNGVSLISVYAGTVDYQATNVHNNTKDTNNSSVAELYRMYRVGLADQTMIFQEVFSGWSTMKHWSLNEAKYFPLLLDKGASNFIEIDDGNDINLINSNLTGKFKVVKDITIDASQYESNWIIKGLFQGVLIGEIEGSNKRPTITIIGFKPTLSSHTSGFFELTQNATISNLSFKWGIDANEPAIDLSIVNDLGIVSGLTCEDTNSLISNVEVRVATTNTDDGYIIDDNGTNTIAGFGGLVGTSTNTNILSSNFIGKIRATLKSADDVYVGGIVANATTKKDEGTTQTTSKTSVINASSVGAPQNGGGTTFEGVPVAYPTTIFDLTLANNESAVYVGAVAGKTNGTAIATTNVGGKDYGEGYKNVQILVNLGAISDNVYVGGMVGSANNGQILSSQVWTKTEVISTAKISSSNILVGGLIGKYEIDAADGTTRIAKCDVSSEISTAKSEEEYLTTDVSTSVKLSAGVAEMSVAAQMQQCYIQGSVNTEKSAIGNLYAGGAVAFVNSGERSLVDIEEVIAYVDLIVGSGSTTQLSAGGLIGFVSNNVAVSYSASWGKLVPVTSNDAKSVFAGGLIGKIDDSTKPTVVNNCYTISSIVADSIDGKVLKDLHFGGLVGAIPSENTAPQYDGGILTSGIKFEKVYYSSDIALFADENYLTDKTPLGTNVAGEFLLLSNVWHADLKTEDDVENAIWNTLNVDLTTFRLPYLTSLEAVLYGYEIITKESGNSPYNYKSGSAMNPHVISGDYEFKSEYSYYILKGDSIPTLTNALNGILIAKDNSFEVTSLSNATTAEGNNKYYGIVPIVEAHSAISNLHVEIKADISQDGNFGVIAGLNNGVIFNCSVQGNGIKFENEKSDTAGLISCVNNGLISYSYSSAEILSCKAQIGGIVHTNNKNLLSNYFTGYLDSDSYVAGLSVRVSGNNYAYNNYMAGVVLGNVGYNKTFYQLANGENNYVDSYVDLDYTFKNYEGTGNTKKNDYNLLAPVSTAKLMANENVTIEDISLTLYGLAGEWFTVVVDGKFETDEKTFGLNYNYPIYRFNKYSSNDGVSLNTYTDEYKHNLNTGKGEVGKDETGEDLTITARYSALIGGKEVDDGKGGKIKVANDEYVNAFKIPHLGVLTSLNALLDQDRNFVIIHDLDGSYGEKSLTWKPLGIDDDVNGFKRSGESFKGVVVSNKNFDYNAKDEYCTISNLSGAGLFNNVANSAFGNISFGNFNNLKGSGVLGLTVSGSTYVNNIKFVERSKVTGDSDSYLGSLFGTVQGALEVGNLITANTEGVPTLRLKSKNSTAGLIAGCVTGTITLKSESYTAWFDGHAYAGGLVGNLAGGTITAEPDTTINLIASNDREPAEYCTGMMGGLVGNAQGGILSGAFTVNLKNTSGGPVRYKTNGFGGLVGYADGAIILDDCDITIDSKNLEFVGDKPTKRYYGLVVGEQNSGTIAPTSGAANIDISTIKGFNVETAEGIIISNDQESGVGVLAGKSAGTLSIALANKFTISFEMLNIHNLGGLVGYATGDVDLSGTSIASESIVTLEGIKNVGGLIGFFEGTLDGKLLLDEVKFTIIVNIGVNFGGVSFENIGGLIGLWKGSNSSNTTLSSGATIQIGTTIGTVTNVGGVVGCLTGQINNATFAGSFNYTSDSKVTVDSSKIENDNSLGQQITKPMNVGGIVGKAETIESASTSIVNCVNISKVVGYQNVGGIVGYLSQNSTVVNSSSIQLEATGVLSTLLDDAGNISIDTNGTDDDTSDDKTIKIEKPTYGDIYGVINVGGVAGFAAKESSISQVYSRANVYGNTNVGGLAGWSNASTFKNNYVTSLDTSKTATVAEESTTFGVVQGIYYNYTYLTNPKDEETKETKSFIPTSVGGAVGTSINSTYAHNLLEQVKVSSALEGEIKEGERTENKNCAVISTVSNYMSNVLIGSGNSGTVAEFENLDKTYDLDKISTKVIFNKVKSGFGGFIGTTDVQSLINVPKSNDEVATVEEGDAEGETPEGEETPEETIPVDSIESNNIKDITINAQLGVNVGTLYGAVKLEDDSQMILKPRLTSTKEDKEIFVDGAYNVGGLIGFLHDGAGQTFDKVFEQISNMNNVDAVINLQTNFTGIYVGGLIGKTEQNTINNLNYKSNTIQIATNNCYYAGGLIGQACVSQDNATLTLGVGQDYDVVKNGNDKVANFGGVIGMLKVGKFESGLSVTVQGTHYYPFTINTIENSNYYEGESLFSAEEDSAEIRLKAQAYYINLDKFSISPSKNDAYHGSNAANPFDGEKTGWAQDYTIAKAIQRNIPMSENNGAEWDSIATVYDAQYIKAVKIGEEYIDVNEDGKYTDGEPYTDEIENKKWDDDFIRSTLYEECAGSPMLYTRKYIASPIVKADGSYLTEADTTSPNYTGEDFNEDVIKPAILEMGYPEKNEQLANGQKAITYESLANVDNGGGFNLVDYDGKKVWMMHIVIMKNSPAKSGSLFETTGRVDPIPQGTGSVAWWKYIILGVVVVGGVALMWFFPPAAGAIFSSVPAIIGAVAFVGGAAITIDCVVKDISIAEYNALMQFAQSEYQSSGYLSSTYTREIRYSDDEIVYSSDDLKTFDNTLYQPYSSTRPNDFYTNHYVLIEANVSKNDSGNMVVSSKEGAAVQEKSNKDVLKENIKEGRLEDETPVNYTTINGSAYAVYEKYIYQLGGYWINIAVSQGEYKPTSEFFTKTASQYLYHQTMNNNYVYGYWNGSDYQFVSKDKVGEDDGDFYQNYSYADTFVKSCDNSQAIISYDSTLADVTINADGTTKTVFEKPIRFAYAETQKGEGGDPWSGEEGIIASNGYVLGYDYMYGAYYTAIDHGYKDSSKKPLIQYATFTYCGQDEPTTGTKGVHYIEMFENVKEYDEFGKVIRNEDVPHYYTICNSAFETSVAEDTTIYTHNTTYSTLPKGGDITVVVYASQFANPYTGYGNIKHDEKYYLATIDHGIVHNVKYFLYVGGFKVDGENNVYTRLEDNAYNSGVALYFKDGDKVHQIQKIEIEDVWYDLWMNWGSKYTYTTHAALSLYWETTVTIVYDNTEEHSLMLSDCYLDAECKIPVTSMYIRSDETIEIAENPENQDEKLVVNMLYIKNGRYSITNGLISRMFVSYDSAFEKGENYTYNMYLSYSKDKTKLYTRFKYLALNSNKSSLESIEDFNSIFKKSNSKPDEYYELIINGSGCPNSKRTMLKETVKVTLGGENIYLYSTDPGGASFTNAGSMTVLKDDST